MKSPQRVPKPSTIVAPTKLAASKNFTQEQLKQFRQHSETGNYSVMLDQDFVQTSQQNSKNRQTPTDHQSITNKIKQKCDHHRLKELEQMFSLIPPSDVGQVVQRKHTAPVQFNNFIQHHLSPNFKKSLTNLEEHGMPKRQNFTPMPQSLKMSEHADFPPQYRDTKQSFTGSQVCFNRESVYQRSNFQDFSEMDRTLAPSNQYSIFYKGVQQNTLLEGDITLKYNLDLNSLITADQRGSKLIHMINYQYQIFLKSGVMRKKCIELPGADIRIKGQNMNIRTPIFFKGNPGTVIEVESSIIVDIDSSILSQNKFGYEENKQQKDSENIEFSKLSKDNTYDSIAVTEFQLRPLVQFSECTIKFDRQLVQIHNPIYNSDQQVTQSIQIGARNANNIIRDDENKVTMNLFQVVNGSKLILRDCQLKSQAYQKFINSSNFGASQVCDIAFYLDANNTSNGQRSKMSTAVSLNPLKRNSSSELSIISCTMEGFSHFVKGGEEADILIELSALRGSRLSALQLSNPRNVKILRTIIEKSTGSGLSIRSSSRDKQVIGAGSMSQQNHFSNILSQQLLKREVLIDGAIIMGNTGHGVSIEGNQSLKFQNEQINKGQDIGANLSKQQVKDINQTSLSPFFTRVQIRKTRIYHCKKDGIMLKNITLSQDGKIVLDSNQLQNNKGNNIWLEKIHQPNLKDGSMVKISKEIAFQKKCISSFIIHSRIYDAELGFGVYINSANCQIQDSQILGNTAGGIYISRPPVSKSQKEKLSTHPYCRVIQSTIKSNKDSGILSVDFFGRLDIARCQISDNIKNGIFSSQKLQSFTSMLNKNNFDSPSNTPPTQNQSSNSLLSNKPNNRSTDANSLQSHPQFINSKSLNPRDTKKLVRRSKAQINIEICDISYNSKNGISMNNVRLNIKQSRIQNNGMNAVSLNESNKLLIKILDTKCFTGHQVQQKKLVQGKVGGEWGSYPNAFKTKQQFESQEDEEEQKFYYNDKIVNKMSSGQSSNVIDDKGVRKGGVADRQNKGNKIQSGQGKRQKSGCCFPASNKGVDRKQPAQIKGSDKALCTTQERLE